jgi:hypothetical protein
MENPSGKLVARTILAIDLIIERLACQDSLKADHDVAFVVPI